MRELHRSDRRSFLLGSAALLGTAAFPVRAQAAARAFLAFHFASFFARLAIPAKSFFPLFLLRLVSSIWE